MTPALISGTGTPTSKDRKLPPFVGSLLSKWDARHADDGAVQPGSRISDPLTARERDVLEKISQGLSNKRVARALEISHRDSEIARKAYLFEAGGQHPHRGGISSAVALAGGTVTR